MQAIISNNPIKHDLFFPVLLGGIIFVTKGGMKRKDIVSALLGILIMAITYWVLFYQLSPRNHKPVKTFSALPHSKNLE